MARSKSSKGLGKQAKILTDMQIKTALAVLEKTRNPERDRVMFLLSAKAGLRAKEISCLTWAMVTDAEGSIGKFIYLENKASKGQSGRQIPINKDLGKALKVLKDCYKKQGKEEEYVIVSERSDRMRSGCVVDWFRRKYQELGFIGCSSHSGRRTFVTNAARKITLVGGSLKDVQDMAGHSSLQTTQKYIQGSTDAKVKVVDLI